MENDIVYFELNNWFAGMDYPDAEPFTTWCGNDRKLYFSDEKFVKKNKLCVVEQYIDMSVNWCITAPKSFVLKNCPKLLSDESTQTVYHIQSKNEIKEIIEDHPYKEFLRFPDEDGDVYGRFGAQFLPYEKENIGITIAGDD